MFSTTVAGRGRLGALNGKRRSSLDLHEDPAIRHDVVLAACRVSSTLYRLSGKLRNVVEKNKVVKDSKENHDADFKQAEEERRQQEAEHEKKMTGIQDNDKNLEREELGNDLVAIEGIRDQLRQELEERRRKVRNLYGRKRLLSSSRQIGPK